MKEFRSTEIKLLGAFFLVAGLFGLFMFFGVVFPLNNLISVVNIFPTILFALTVYSGYLLLLKENVKGLEIGRAVIALQIINFHIGGVGYVFVTGVYVFAGFVNFDIGVTAGLENTFVINIAHESDEVVFRVNILALAIFIYLTKVMNKVYDQQEMQELSGKEKSDVENFS